MIAANTRQGNTVTARIPNTREERTTAWVGVALALIGIAIAIFVKAFWLSVTVTLISVFLGGVFLGTAAEARSNRINAMRFEEARRMNKRGWN